MIFFIELVLGPAFNGFWRCPGSPVSWLNWVVGQGFIAVFVLVGSLCSI